ncbi:MAG: hypothetical protein JRI68_30805, partial [Deltaproteobacteria bacterium]|nr:hypothetical protein [Deltaproteobacteria bacterium]
YLYFGISTLTFAGMPCAEVLIFWRAIDPTLSVRLDSLLDGIVVTTSIALPTLLHYALRYVRAKREWTIMAPVYGFYGLSAVLAAAGMFWSHVPYQYEVARAWGLEWLNLVALELTPWGQAYYAILPIILGAVVYLLGRAFQAGRREGLGAFGGSIALMLSVLHDAAVGVGLIASPPLIAVGIFVMGYGVSLTLVARHGTLSAALQRRTDQLNRRSEELKRSYAELERTQHRLVESERLAMVGELAAVIAHEVRNPSAIINNVLATLGKSRTEQEERELLLGILGEEAGRLGKLADRLRDFSRPVVLRSSSVDLGEVLKRSLQLLGNRPEVDLTVDILSGVSSVPGDGGLLRQAFDNVVTNAMQAVGAQGRLAVKVEPKEVEGIETVAVSFHDDGEGMSATARDQALSPFFTTRPTGTGLGLPIVGRIVEAHGGRVAIHSAPGEGTTVSLLLPRQAGARMPAQARRHRRISLLP